MKTQEELKDRFSQLGFIWPEFHLIGERSKEDKPNSFDDLFYFIVGDKVVSYTGTTNPGSYWLQHPMNVDGTAIMKSDQQCIDAYALGRHKGVHKAWVQVKPIYFFRDNDLDLKSEEEGKLIYDCIGANVHHANAVAVSTLIEKWSAGCQVFNNPTEHKQLIYLSEKTGLKNFTYTLLKEF
jgi:hypothetical protein